MIRAEEFGYPIPQPGWPGRGRAIARLWLHVVVMAATAILLLVAFSGTVLVIAASMDALPR